MPSFQSSSATDQTNDGSKPDKPPSSEKSNAAKEATIAALKAPLFSSKLSQSSQSSNAHSQSNDQFNATNSSKPTFNKSSSSNHMDLINAEFFKPQSAHMLKKSETFVRADKLDFQDLDVSIAQHFPKSKTVNEVSAKKTDSYSWEIDLDKLVLKNQIAKGTYGTVHRGIYSGQEVAVKLLDWGEDNTMCRANLIVLRKAFMQEVTVWSQLSHPNVTAFIGASMGKNEGFMLPSFRPGKNGDIKIGGNVCCVILEYIAGGTLKNYLIRNCDNKLSFKTVVQLALDLANGLNYMHSKRIVHRDVKTENLLMDKQGKVKIADFGVARVKAPNDCDMTGETGTLGYMAPEVLNGKAYNEKADIYSFGICLWEIYVCDMPFPDLSLKEMAAMVNQGLRPVIPKCCPPSLSSVMQRCWDGNPKKRPSMAEVVDMLKAIDVKKGKAMVKNAEVRMSSGCFCI